MQASLEPPSKTRVDKAGRRLRAQALDPVILEAAAAELRRNDILAVDMYRQLYADPLLKVRMGLTSFATTIGISDVAITQRTKRYSRIVAKLVRFPGQRLSQMQDIGGIRIVVNGLAESNAMVERILHQWSEQIRRHDDYASNPQPSGYRSHHVVVRRDDRLIEIQVRTENEHTWAENVESTGRLIGVELKWGDGTSEILSYYELLGQVVDLLDRGLIVPAALSRRTKAAQDQARKGIISVLKGGGPVG